MGKTRHSRENGQGGSNKSGKTTSADASSADRVIHPSDLQDGDGERSYEDGGSLADGGLDELGKETERERQRRYLRLRVKAERALEVLCDSPRVPANVRAASARTLLELTGAIGRNREQDQGDKLLDLEPDRLTLADIDAEILRTGEV